jgi:hypothetical protein
MASVDELIEAELSKYDKEPNPGAVAGVLLPQLSEAQTWEVASEGLVNRVVRLMGPHRRKGGRWYRPPGPSRRAMAQMTPDEREALGRTSAELADSVRRAFEGGDA